MANKSQSAPSSPATVEVLPFVPDKWPGAFGAYKHSRAAVMLNLVPILLLVLLSVAISVAVSIITSIFNHAGVIAVLGEIVNTVASIVISAAFIVVYLSSIKGKKLKDPQPALEQVWPVAWKYFLLSLLVGFTVVGGFILFIIPGIIILPRLALASYFFIDQKMDVMDAFKASWNHTKGHSAKVWGIIGASILMALLMVTIIGIPFAIYFLFMYQAVLAVLYSYVKAHPQTVRA
jgi:hypothetical protein